MGVVYHNTNRQPGSGGNVGGGIDGTTGARPASDSQTVSYVFAEHTVRLGGLWPQTNDFSDSFRPECG